MTKFAKVKDYKGLVREMHSKAILNTDAEALKNHRRKKAMMKHVMDNSDKITKMENDLKEIKELLYSMGQNTRFDK